MFDNVKNRQKSAELSKKFQDAKMPLLQNPSKKSIMLKTRRWACAHKCIHQHSDSPLPKAFCHGIGNDRVQRKTAVPAGAQRNCWTYIEHNAAIMEGHMFVQCLFCALLGAFVIYAFDLHIFRRQEAYRSMTIKELYIGSEKGRPPLRVSSMELIKGVGPKGEAHGKHQAGLWSAEDRARLEPIKEQALCARRFFANIIIDSFDIPLNAGDTLHAGSAVMQVRWKS